MKPFIALLLIFSLALFASPPAHSQSTMTASKNILTNADTSTHQLDLAGQINNFEVITVQVIGTKTSGTVAGTAVLTGSLDGTNYFAVGADTLTLANVATNSKVWQVDKSRYRYYRVKVITSGTQVSSYVCKLFGRKQP
jgi:environmental stress-induced protein Ves